MKKSSVALKSIEPQIVESMKMYPGEVLETNNKVYLDQQSTTRKNVISSPCAKFLVKFVYIKKQPKTPFFFFRFNAIATTELNCTRLWSSELFFISLKTFETKLNNTQNVRNRFGKQQHRYTRVLFAITQFFM